MVSWENTIKTRQWSWDQDVDDLAFPTEYKDHMLPLTFKTRQNTQFKDERLDCAKILHLLKLKDGQVNIADELWHKIEYLSFGSPHIIGFLDDDDLLHLTQVYRLFFPDQLDIECTIFRCYDQYALLECTGGRFGSRFSKLSRC